MKLAEALILRADYQKRLQQLRHRLENCVLVQEGEEPMEDPQALLAEVAELTTTLTALIQNINRTNSQTVLRDGLSLTDALAERDMLNTHRAILQNTINNASQRPYRYGRSEIKYLPAVNVGELQKQVDDLARQHRELDAEIQAFNWQTEFIEA